MGRNLVDDQLKWTLDINGDPARKELGELNQATRELEKTNSEYRKELAKLERQGKQNSKEYKALKKSISENNKQIVQGKAKMAEYRQQIGLTGLTIRELNSEQKRLRNLLNNTVPGTPRFKEYEAQLKAVTAQKRNLQGDIKKTNKAFGALKNALPIIGLATVAAGVARLGKELFGIGKQMQGETRKHAIVLGDSLGYVDEQADLLSKRMGVTNHQFKTMVTNSADLLVPLEFNRQTAAKMGVQIQSLAGAFDEWTAGQFGVADASEILNKAVLGEMEGLKKYGIAILQDSEEFKTLVKEMQAAGAQTKAQAKAMATIELITRKSADAQAAYNQEGNKLIRWQKNANLQLRKFKENIVKSFDTSLEKKFENQTKRVNELVMELTDANTETERRVELLSELEIINPKIVSGLDSENIELDKLTTNLQAYNEELTNRIILANLEKEEEKLLAKVAKQKQAIAERDATIYQKILEFRQDIAVSDQTSFEKQREFVEWLEKEVDLQERSGTAGKVRVSGLNLMVDTRTKEQKLLESIRFALEANEKIESRMSKDASALINFQDRVEIMREILGLNKTLVDDPPPTPIPNTKDLLSELDAQNSQIVLKIKQRYAEELISKQEFDNQMLIQELAYLSAKAQLLIDDPEKRADALQKIADKEIDIMEATFDAHADLEKENDKFLDEIEKEEQKDFEASMAAKLKVIELRYDTEQKLREENSKKSKEAHDEDKKLMEDKVDLYNSYAADVGTVLGEAIADGEISMEDFGRNIITLGLDILRNQLHLMLAKLDAEAVVKALAGDFSGVLKSAAGHLAIEGVYAAAKSAVSGSGKKLYVGGHTGTGGKYDPKGVVHANEYVIPQEGVMNPAIRPFIDALEYARKNGNLQLANMSSLVGVASQRGFAAGGFTDPQGSAQPDNSIDSFTLDMMITLLEANLTAMNQVTESHMMPSKVVYTDIEDAGETLSAIRDKASISK